ncbi:MAG: hypothetical protein K6A74_06575 [Lachnospiraceae bacterium]|nr:hypothetical protein [Lachnospiraceae bacterium]
MAKEQTAAEAEKKKIKEERNRLKQEEKQQKKEIKKRAKEISKREAAIEDEDESGGGISSFLVTTVIVVVWLLIICLLIKMDVGGFGSEVLTPLLKDVPVVNKILPSGTDTEVSREDAYGGYTSLKEAVDYIKILELELEHAQQVNNTDSEEITELKAEVERLKEFENMQVEFQRIKEQFYEEVVYSDKGPGPEEYQKYYQTMDPETAQALYKQVVRQLEEDQEVKDYAAAYSSMKPKAAAAIFESMTDDLELAARILWVMDSDSRGKILGAMDSTVAAKLTKIMDPDD